MRRSYTRQDVEDARRQLTKMPPKHKSSGLSMREVVAELEDDVHQAFKRGYTIAEVAGVLIEQGMAIKPGTLRAYLRPRTQERTSEPSGTKSRNENPETPGTPSDEKTLSPATGSQSGRFKPREDRESI